MDASSLPFSSVGDAGSLQNSARDRPEAPVRAAGILAERWPTLARALGRYEQATAERFSQLAYDSVDAGIIRLDVRKRLAAEADAAGIRPFDAQLLIACAIRQWAMDHRYDGGPSPDAPALSFEYKAWRKVWLRLAIVFGFAITIDFIIIWKWLS
jgi:hypothetical protein